MVILGITALIVLVVFGVLVLRVKSDPLENKAIQQALADSKRTTSAVSPAPAPDSDSTSTATKTP